MVLVRGHVGQMLDEVHDVGPGIHIALRSICQLILLFSWGISKMLA